MWKLRKCQVNPAFSTPSPGCAPGFKWKSFRLATFGSEYSQGGLRRTSAKVNGVSYLPWPMPDIKTMARKKIVGLLFRFTLLDELFGFAYWALVILVSCLMIQSIKSILVLILTLTLYIPVATVCYIVVLKRLKYFLSGHRERSY